MAAAVQPTIEELCEAWATATDADAVGELADELAKRALDVRDPDDVARLCSAIVARLNGSKSDDDEIAAVLDAVTCGPLGTPGARGDALRRETLVFPGGIAWGLDSRFHGPALRAASAEFLLACARRDAERPVPRSASSRGRRPYFSRETGFRVADPASRRLRALVATFGPAAPSYITTLRRRRVGEMEIKYLREAVERARAQRALQSCEACEACEVAERLGSILSREFFERDWEARCVWRRADGSGGSRSCFRGSSPALAAPRWPAGRPAQATNPRRHRRSARATGPTDRPSTKWRASAPVVLQARRRSTARAAAAMPSPRILPWNCWRTTARP